MPGHSKAKPRGPLPDEIATWLSQRIHGGTLAAGALLPSERELTARFGVSRTVVREALARLKSDGLIAAHQGKGAFVSQRRDRHSFRLRDVVLREKPALAHIIELLITFEVAATRLAATRRTADELKRMRQALVGMEFAIAHDRLGDEEDYAFHQAIFDATHNPHFQALSEYLENSVRRLIRQARDNTARKYASRVQAVQREHEAIYDAITSRNAPAAALAAETHLRNAARRLDMYLDAAPAAKGAARAEA